MIKNWLISGDTHGKPEARLKTIKDNSSEYIPEETAVIILGDVGLNFYLNNTDRKHKQAVAETGYMLYCVRGNHEERPENLNYTIEYDDNVNGHVYVESEFPTIKYFMDGAKYIINGYTCLVIGGAYSIDKNYRLAQAASMGSSFSGWFPDEMLSSSEMEKIGKSHEGQHFDFVFTHTCPISWEPTDLFLSFVPQENIDKSMELWMNDFKNTIDWCVWCFGHFHADRIERPHVEQYYNTYENMDIIWNRWQNYDITKEIDWWIPKSPMWRAI